MSTEKVREGMLLAVRDERRNLPVKYDLWSVKRVGKPTKAGHVTATLIAADKRVRSKRRPSSPRAS